MLPQSRSSRRRDLHPQRIATARLFVFASGPRGRLMTRLVDAEEGAYHSTARSEKSPAAAACMSRVPSKVRSHPSGRALRVKNRHRPACPLLACPMAQSSQSKSLDSRLSESAQWNHTAEQRCRLVTRARLSRYPTLPVWVHGTACSPCSITSLGHFFLLFVNCDRDRLTLTAPTCPSWPITSSGTPPRCDQRALHERAESRANVMGRHSRYS